MEHHCDAELRSCLHTVHSEPSVEDVPDIVTRLQQPDSRVQQVALDELLRVRLRALDSLLRDVTIAAELSRK